MAQGRPMTAARRTWDLCKTLRDVTAAVSRNHLAADGGIIARVDLLVLDVLRLSIIPNIKGDIDRGSLMVDENSTVVLIY